MVTVGLDLFSLSNSVKNYFRIRVRVRVRIRKKVLI